MIDTFKNQMPNKKPRPTRLDSSVYAFVFFLFCFVLFFFSCGLQTFINNRVTRASLTLLSYTSITDFKARLTSVFLPNAVGSYLKLSPFLVKPLIDFYIYSKCLMYQVTKG